MSLNTADKRAAALGVGAGLVLGPATDGTLANLLDRRHLAGLARLGGVSVTLQRTTHAGNVEFTAVPAVEHSDIRFYWWVDGRPYQAGRVRTCGVDLDEEDDVEVFVIATTDPDLDVEEIEAEFGPRRRIIEFVRSPDTDVSYYRVEWQTTVPASYAADPAAPAPGDWEMLLRVPVDGGRWVYRFLTPRLTHGSHYWFRVTPVSIAGNDGTASEIGPYFILCRPEVVEFTVSYSAGTNRVTFTAV